MSRSIIRVIAALVLCASAIATESTASVGAAGTWASVTFATYAEDGALTSLSALAKPSNGESSDYKLIAGGVRWLPGPKVRYQIVGAPFPQAVHGVVEGEQNFDPYVTTRKLKHDDASPDANPCNGQPNVVRWAPIDGPGHTLALTIICYNTNTNEIGGWETTFDSLDGWAIGNDDNNATYDLVSVATHEFGHVAGLDSLTDPADACLTMYAITGPETKFQRTLGLGDKLGMDFLYQTGDTKPGPGCGK